MLTNNPIWLFFDMGSTLIDEQPCNEYIFREIAKDAGVLYEQVAAYAEKTIREDHAGNQAVADHFGVPKPRWPGELEFLYPDTAACLASLHQNYKIGIIANQKPGSEDRLRKWGILQYIDLLVASAEEGVSKPNPEIFLRALARCNTALEDTIMVGDRIDNDIIPAKNLGMGTIWIRQGIWSNWEIRNEEEKSDLTVDSLTELCKIL